MPENPPSDSAGTSPYLGAPADGTPTLDPSGTGRAVAPRRVGDYEILGVLGEGGMGVVYEARHEALKRSVALKMIRAAGATDKQLRRFRAETEAIARLQHPGIVAIYEVGEHDGEPFCALELLRGGSLAERLEGKALPPRQAARLVESLARAAHAVHEQGVVHRDLKPANVLLHGSPDDPIDRCVPKIGDFGLAKALDGEAASGLTQQGAVMGTPAYMAPEQAAGRGDEIDRRADVYSLGAILHECLTGRPPFLGATVTETLWLALNQEPAAPRVDRDLDIICLKCLEKEPARRFSTALELADELERYLNDEPIRTRRVGPAERVVKWARRRPAAAAAWLLTLLVLLLGSAGGFAGWQWKRAEEARDAAELERGRADAARAAAEEANEGLEKQKRLAEEARAWALDGIRRLDEQAKKPGDAGVRLRAEFDAERRRARQDGYFDHIDLAHLRWRAGQLRQARLALARCGDAGRSWEYGYVERLCHGATLPTPPGLDVTPARLAFAPDGGRLAAIGPHGLAAWDVPGEANPMQVPLSGRWVLFTPDGRRLVVPFEKGVKLLDAKTGKEVRALANLTPNGVLHAAISRDAARLAVVEERDGAVTLIDLATGKPLRKLAGLNGRALQVEFAPDGKRLAVAADGGFHLFDAAGEKQERFIASGVAGHASPLGFSPDGRHVACIDGSRVGCWDVVTGERLLSFEAGQRIVRCVAFAADGRLVSGGSDATVRLWNAKTGRAEGEYRSLPGQVESLAIDPKGRFVAASDGDGHAAWWNPNVGQELDFLDAGGTVTSLAFRPDGKVVAVRAGGAQVFDSATGKRVAGLGGGDGVAYGGPWLARFGESGVIVRDGATGREAWRDNGPVSGVAFGPSGGGRVAVAGRRLTVRDAATGKELVAVAGANPTASVAFAPDGKRLAAVSGNDAVMYDAETGRESRRLAHTSLVNAVAFSADGRRVATGGYDDVVQVWDAETGRPALTLPGPGGVVRALAFSPDGRWLACGSIGGACTYDAGERERKP